MQTLFNWAFFLCIVYLYLRPCKCGDGPLPPIVDLNNVSELDGPSGYSGRGPDYDH
jgi:hypothetical protein